MPRLASHEDDASTSALLATVARNLAWVREIVAPSQSAVARRLGLANPAIWQRYEAGTRWPDPRVLVRFCDLYGCTLDFIYRSRLEGMPQALVNRLVALHPELVLTEAELAARSARRGRPEDPASADKPTSPRRPGPRGGGGKSAESGSSPAP